MFVVLPFIQCSTSRKSLTITFFYYIDYFCNSFDRATLTSEIVSVSLPHNIMYTKCSNFLVKGRLIGGEDEELTCV